MSNILNEFALKFENETMLSRFLITISLFFLLYIIKKSIRSFIDKLNLNSKLIIRYKKISSTIINLIFIIIVVPIWMYESTDILTFLGIFSAGVAFAFRDVLANYLGWIIINARKPFQVGDRIKLGGNVGDVLEINWFHTILIEVINNNNNKTYGQSTGRLISIPNIKILTEELINEAKSFPYVWNEIDIPLALDSNWSKAKEIILTIASHRLENIEEEAKDSLSIASRTLPIYYENLSYIIYTNVENGKIILTLRFICRSRIFRNLKHNIIEDILSEFSKYEDIKII